VVSQLFLYSLWTPHLIFFVCIFCRWT
jgi:hypothetical protein